MFTDHGLIIVLLIVSFLMGSFKEVIPKVTSEEEESIPLDKWWL